MLLTELTLAGELPLAAITGGFWKLCRSIFSLPILLIILVIQQSLTLAGVALLMSHFNISTKIKSILMRISIIVAPLAATVRLTNSSKQASSDSVRNRM
ncbi:hypothetical protein WJX73_008780 [Symbiochloris irregularis]|uniref:Uncharacterized protein n=1 Tax=Symbiochloris irregularis TaxID=706552 RepID=A0AAW1PAG7_9CHLO